MKDKIVLITGGTGGIGKQTALALARLGAQVVVTGRNPASGAAAVRELQGQSGNPSIDLFVADLAVQADVRSLAERFGQHYGRLDVLLNNAGVAEPQRRLTADGIETDLAVNVIAPFLLTHLLLDRLLASPSARVITLAGGQHPARIDLDNLQGEKSFVGLTAYSHAKLVMMAVMYELAQRMRDERVTVNVCYPGQAATHMTQSVTPAMLPVAMRLIYPLYKLATRRDDGRSAAKAARASVYLAASSEVEGITGKYFNPASKPVDWPAAVLDLATRQHLWEIIERLARLST